MTTTRGGGFNVLPLEGVVIPALLLFLFLLLLLVLDVSSDQFFVHAYRVDKVASCPEMVTPIRLFLQSRITFEQLDS